MMQNISSKESKKRHLREKLKKCDLCPRKCGVDRTKGEKGICGLLDFPVVSSWGLHFGEEKVLVGLRGSGTVFFTGCNLKCIFCQNYEISHFMEGEVINVEKLASIFKSLESRGALNINLVTPTHQIPFIVEALEIANLNIPIVYNCGGYESIETLELLEGWIDVYMPDMKYGSNEIGKNYSGVPDYFDRASEALKFMVKQVGEPIVENGIMKKGVLVRHLVLPNNVEDSMKVIDFLATLTPPPLVNVMAQYYPMYKAWERNELSRRLKKSEYLEVIEYAKEKNLRLIELERWLF